MLKSAEVVHNISDGRSHGLRLIPTQNFDTRGVHANVVIHVGRPSHLTLFAACGLLASDVQAEIALGAIEHDETLLCRILAQGYGEVSQRSTPITDL